VIAIVTLVVALMIAIALMDNANATFIQGYRQPRMLALQSMADGGAQYGYWQVIKQNAPLPYNATGVAMGNGTFDVSVTNNAAIPGTFKVVSTSHIKMDIYSVTRIFSSGMIPTPPTNLIATAGNGVIVLTWTASAGATSYNIYRGTSAGGESSTPIATGVAGTTYTDTTVVAGTTYYYYVTAVGPTGGESSGTTEASGTPTSSTASLNVSFTTRSAAVNLTTQGTVDWDEWGYNNTRNSKSTGAGLISDLSYGGGGTPAAFTSGYAYSWTDGTPNAVVSNTNATYSLTGDGTSFTVTLPTDTTTHVATIYCAEVSSITDFNVTMSGTSLSYDDASNMTTSTGNGGHVYGIYTIVYNGNAGGTLTVTFTLTKHHGSPSGSMISMQAVTLQ